MYIDVYTWQARGVHTLYTKHTNSYSKAEKERRDAFPNQYARAVLYRGKFDELASTNHAHNKLYDEVYTGRIENLRGLKFKCVHQVGYTLRDFPNNEMRFIRNRLIFF